MHLSTNLERSNCSRSHPARARGLSNCHPERAKRAEGPGGRLREDLDCSPHPDPSARSLHSLGRDDKKGRSLHSLGRDDSSLDAAEFVLPGFGREGGKSGTARQERCVAEGRNGRVGGGRPSATRSWRVDAAAAGREQIRNPRWAEGWATPPASPLRCRAASGTSRPSRDRSRPPRRRGSRIPGSRSGRRPRAGRVCARERRS